MAAASESKRLQLLSRIGLSGVALALILTLLGAWYATSQPVATIDAKKLDNYQKSLTSYTAESYLLAYQYHHGRALANYTATSADKLHQAVSGLSDTLETDQADPSVESKVKETADQANNLAEVLGNFKTAVANGQATDFTGKLQNIEQKVSKL